MSATESKTIVEARTIFGFTALPVYSLLRPALINNVSFLGSLFFNFDAPFLLYT